MNIIITGNNRGIGRAITEHCEKYITSDVKIFGVNSDINICKSTCIDSILIDNDINVLINNAGIQQRINLSKLQESWSYYQKEIATNLEAPIHLVTLFIPHLEKQKDAVIANVSSGLAFTPMAAAPVYCATKAAIHSFTMSLRYQLLESGIKVIEIAPPAVSTDLGGPGLHVGMPSPEEFAEGVFKGLENGDQEIGYGTSEARLRMSRDEIDAAVKAINERVPY